MTLREFVVELLEIVVDHALYGETRGDLRHGVLDILNPLGAVALAVLRVVERDDLVLEHLVDGGGIELILVRLVLVGAVLGQRPACALYVTLVPPSVLDGEVEHAVHLRFLAGAFSPDVPEASSGRVGVFSQISTPEMRRLARRIS